MFEAIKTVGAKVWAGIKATIRGAWLTIAAPFKLLWLSAGRKMTILWGYIGIAASVALNQIDLVGPLLGDPELKEQIKVALANNPKLLSYVLGAIFLITIVVRMRSIAFKPRE